MHFAWTCQTMFPLRYYSCAAKDLKALTLFKDEAKEADTVFNAQTEKNDIYIYSRKKQKVRMA